MNSIVTSTVTAHWQLVLACVALALLALIFYKRTRRVILISGVIFILLLTASVAGVWLLKPAWLTEKHTIIVPVVIAKKEIQVPVQLWLDTASFSVRSSVNLNYFKNNHESLMRNSGLLPENGRSTSHDFDRFTVGVNKNSVVASFHDDVATYMIIGVPFSRDIKSRNGGADVTVVTTITPEVGSGVHRVLPDLKVSVSVSANGNTWYTKLVDRWNIKKVQTETERAMNDVLKNLASTTKKVNSDIKNREQTAISAVPLAAWLIDHDLVQLKTATFADQKALTLELAYGIKLSNVLAVLSK